MMQKDIKKFEAIAKKYRKNNSNIDFALFDIIDGVPYILFRDKFDFFHFSNECNGEEFFKAVSTAFGHDTEILYQKNIDDYKMSHRKIQIDLELENEKIELSHYVSWKDLLDNIREEIDDDKVLEQFYDESIEEAFFKRVGEWDANEYLYRFLEEIGVSGIKDKQTIKNEIGAWIDENLTDSIPVGYAR